MVEGVRRGKSLRAVARQFQVSLSTVQLWVGRAHGKRLDRIDWGDRPSIPRRTLRTHDRVEDRVVQLRQELRETSVLGEHGAQAIRGEMVERGDRDIPSIRTIGRILERRGALDGRHRIRRPPPPKGWYLPSVAAGQAEVDSWDKVEGLKIQDGPLVDVLNVISLHSGLVGSWPETRIDAKAAFSKVWEHWKLFGLPRFAQFDNDTIFQGAHHARDSISRVMRLCLALDVIPVFAPPRESGFQAAIESFNGRWQRMVWRRFHHVSLDALKERSRSYVHAVRVRSAPRLDAAPSRRPFPQRDWDFDLYAHPRGKLIFLRRTTDRGKVFLLGQSFDVDPLWPHRLVRSEVDLVGERIRFFALRRRAPKDQPLIRTLPYSLPRRRFQG